jgi:uncharacterized delta-60 repeat protein
LEALEDRSLLTVGPLDPTFGTGGVVQSAFPDRPDFVVARLAQQAGGKLVVAGTVTGTNGGLSLALERFDPDGSLDPTFGSGGSVETPLVTGYYDRAVGLALQGDGKIVVVAQSAPDDIEVRYNSDGSLDGTFGKGGWTGITNGEAHAVAVQPDGKIVFAGTNAPEPYLRDYSFSLARLNPDGSIDKTFAGGNPEAYASYDDEGYPDFNIAYSVLVLPDGRLLASGKVESTPPSGHAVAVAALARFNPDGSLDTTFGQGGKVVSPLAVDPISSAPVSEPGQVALQPDGKVLLLASSGAGFQLARYNPDGSLDTSFGQDGVVSSAQFGPACGLAIQPDGTILVGAESGDNLVVVSFSPDGLRAASFAPFGTSATAGGLVVQPDGQVVVAGSIGTSGAYDAGVARFQGQPVPPTFVLAQDGSLWESGTQGLASISPAGTILAIGPSTAPGGRPEVFALASDHSLWVHRSAGWSELSPAGTINGLSAWTKDLVYAVAGDGSLWQNLGGTWQILSPAGTLLSVSAGTDAAGDPEAFALASDHSLWQLDQDTWQSLSPAGTIAAFSAAGDSAFAVASDGSLWQHDAAGWVELSPAGTILSAVGGTDAGGSTAVFALAADRSFWEYTAALGWQQLSPAGTILSLRNSQGPDVFVVAADGNLWEFDGSAWSRVTFQ